MKKYRIKNIFIISLMLVVVVFFVCAVVSNNYMGEHENDSDNEIILYNSIKCDIAVNYSDISNLINESDIVAIVKIDSKNGTNYNAFKNKYVPVYTTGKLKVENILYSNLKYEVNEGDNIEYVRLGGEIKYSMYLKGLRDVERKKLEYNVAQQVKINSYQLSDKLVKDVYEDDIDIDCGKEYVAFLSYSNDYQKFNIFGFEYGLREFNSKTNSVKNNKNNKFEELKYIKEKIAETK